PPRPSSALRERDGGGPASRGRPRQRDPLIDGTSVPGADCMRRDRQGSAASRFGEGGRVRRERIGARRRGLREGNLASRDREDAGARDRIRSGGGGKRDRSRT